MIFCICFKEIKFVILCFIDAIIHDSATRQVLHSDGIRVTGALHNPLDPYVDVQNR